MLSQTLHDVLVAPGGGCQEGGLAFSVLNVHIAAGFTKGFGHRVIAVPGSTVQGVSSSWPRKEAQRRGECNKMRESTGMVRVLTKFGSKHKAVERKGL